jgi:hypothetical protein
MGVLVSALLASFGWIDPMPARCLHLAGGLGPMVAAIAVTSLARGQTALVRLAKRSAPGRAWIVIAVLIPAGVFSIAIAIIAIFFEDKWILERGRPGLPSPKAARSRVIDRHNPSPAHVTTHVRARRGSLLE